MSALELTQKFSKWTNHRDINGIMAAKDDLVAVGFDNLNHVPLMFQTGYLTIGNVLVKSNLFQLRFPNMEVELGFFKHLLTDNRGLEYEIQRPFH